MTETGRKLHVFDMDGTLLPGTTASLEIARVIGGTDWLAALEDEFRTGTMATREFSAALHRGWGHLTAADVALAFETAPKLERIRSTVRQIHADGDLAVVLTMSPDFFVDHWASYGFDVTVGSRFPALPFVGELDTAGVLTFEDKPRIVAELRERFGVDSTDVVAYGDSHSDVPLFCVAGVSVAVNADAHLRRLATHSYSGDDLLAAYELARSSFG